MATPIFVPAVGFFAELEAHNTREFWAAERHRYDTDVKPRFLEVLDRLGGEWRVYRPHNDARFARAKGPYKTFIGAVTERADGVGTFVQVSARGVLVGTGMPMMATDQLATHRDAVAAEEGELLEAAIAAARSRGAHVHPGRWDPLRRVPRGFDPTHPRAELLRWKGVETNTRVVDPRWTTARQAAAAIGRAVERGAEVDDWLGRHVGPSSMSPEERFGRRTR